jgi:hypothetical protein
VWIDGNEAGITPFEGDLAMGGHQIRVGKKGFADHSFAVKSQTHMLFAQSVTLTRETAAVLLTRAEVTLKKNPATAKTLLEQAIQLPGADPHRVALVQGKIQLAQKVYDAALASFQQALKGKHTRTAATLGLTRVHLGLGDLKAAAGVIIPFLTAHPHHAEAKALLTQVAGSKAVVLITSDPPAAAVTVGTTKLAKTSPVIVAELDARNYPIKLEKVGYKPFEIHKEVKAGEFIAVNVRLEPMP